MVRVMDLAAVFGEGGAGALEEAGEVVAAVRQVRPGLDPESSRS